MWQYITFIWSIHPLAKYKNTPYEPFYSLGSKDVVPGNQKFFKDQSQKKESGEGWGVGKGGERKGRKERQKKEGEEERSEEENVKEKQLQNMQDNYKMKIHACHY